VYSELPSPLGTDIAVTSLEWRYTTYFEGENHNHIRKYFLWSLKNPL